MFQVHSITDAKSTNFTASTKAGWTSLPVSNTISFTGTPGFNSAYLRVEFTVTAAQKAAGGTLQLR